MTDVAITSFKQDVQDYIENRNLDRNGDGFINSDNNELANLLSQTGKTDIKDLYNTGALRAPYTNLTIGTTFAGFGTSYIGQKLTNNNLIQKEMKQYLNNQTTARQIIEDFEKQKKNYENACQRLNFLTDVKDNILDNNKLSQTHKQEVAKLLNGMISDEAKKRNLAAITPPKTDVVAKELRELLKEPFLIRNQNKIKMGTLWGTAAFLVSALFFGAKAVTTHASNKPTEFKV